MDHLKEAASLAEKEVDRRVRLEYSEKAEIEKLKYQDQVSSMIAVMNAINDALKGTQSILHLNITESDCDMRHIF